MAVENPLAYYFMATIAPVKSFIVQAPGEYNNVTAPLYSQLCSKSGLSVIPNVNEKWRHSGGYEIFKHCSAWLEAGNDQYKLIK